ncbi:MAG: deoxyribodipyrimidine photo-lyase [Pedobacter sp.]|nr:MAG: deoxyribodipyrimidine photo-lyase [Pedobacter sp.]
MKTKVTLYWFRRDLRLCDNVALNAALNSPYPVLPIFIFDDTILNQLDDKKDRRVDYIHQALQAINQQLADNQTTLCTYKGIPIHIFKQLNAAYDIQAVYCNRDYEPQAIKRDTAIYDYFQSIGISFKAFKDQVIFDKSDILKADGTPYTVYTPYSHKWKELLRQKPYAGSQTNSHSFANFLKLTSLPIISLEALGFVKTAIRYSQPSLNEKLIADYHQHRDYPAKNATSRLGIAIRFGTISIRQCVKFAQQHNQTWLSELIWREFFMQILYHFPQVATQSFKPKYDLISWRNDVADFEKWCKGQTGYPLVDAGIRELNQTGFMHNRVRMVVASFLCKHLLIDWRWGEAYFASKLDDYDLAANNGNWQWVAGSGCDATPYFRVFNPQLQTDKFDKNQLYIKKWVPELDTPQYPPPMVDHAYARERALNSYRQALGSA